MLSELLDTHSQFQDINSCLAPDFGEIWRIVERTTCTVRVTVPPIIISEMSAIQTVEK